MKEGKSLRVVVRVGEIACSLQIRFCTHRRTKLTMRYYPTLLFVLSNILLVLSLALSNSDFDSANSLTLGECCEHCLSHYDICIESAPSTTSMTSVPGAICRKRRGVGKGRWMRGVECVLRWVPFLRG